MSGKSFLGAKFESDGGPNNVQCPKCDYPHASLRNFARRGSTGPGAAAGGIVGGLAGGELGGEGGAAIGFGLLGPAGAVMGFLLGASLGAFSGHIVGKLLDKDVLGMYYCPKCGHKFIP